MWHFVYSKLVFRQKYVTSAFFYLPGSLLCPIICGFGGETFVFLNTQNLHVSIFFLSKHVNILEKEKRQ